MHRTLHGPGSWLALLLIAGSAAQAQAQNAVISGRVTTDQNQPLQGANVFISELNISVGTNAAGAYTISIPAVRVSGQTVQLRVRSVGFAPATQPITIQAGSQVANFALRRDAARLSEIVVTGVTAATEQIKVPFTVAKVDSSLMPVAGSNALSQLQGKVPGVAIVSATGRPGASPSVVLRGAVSLNASGRSQEPLYIVDGVLLQGALPDLNPQDIESMEIVKGAAAASLYGARAGAGVINITTKSGKLAEPGVVFGFRSELGAGDIEREFSIAKRTAISMDPTRSAFCAAVTAGGSPCARVVDLDVEARRVNDIPSETALNPQSLLGDGGIAIAPGYQQLTGLFQVNRYPVTRNVIDQLVTSSAYANTSIDMRGKSGNTGFYASVSNLQQQGAVRFLDGFTRNSARINLDHSFADELTLSLTSYYSQSSSDGANQDAGGAGNGFFRLTRQPAFVDVLRRDQLGRLYIRSNVLNQGSQNSNPAYDIENFTQENSVGRFIGGLTTRYTPWEWLTLDANFSYDRRTGDFTRLRDRGFRATTASPGVSNGTIDEGTTDDQTYNTGIGATVRRQLMSDLQATFNVRYAYDQQDLRSKDLDGDNLVVPGLVTSDAAVENFGIGSDHQSVRNVGFFGGVDFDYKDRYVVGGLLRRDGSSLFGEGNRWATFGRISGAWIASREPWWFASDALSLMKLRASYGTTGQRPRFSAQYETFTIGDGGTLNPATLGNKNLRPEVITETEVGADLELFSRYGVNVTYAMADARDQLLPVKPPTGSGFQTQWQNAGTLQNKTLEISLDIPLIQRPTVGWSTRLIYDRTRSRITQLNVPPFTGGVNLQGAEAIYLFKEGERLGTMYGRDFIRSCAQLPSTHSGSCGGAGSAFQTNSDGYVVWVGEGNKQTEGITRNLWQANLPAANAPWGQRVNWGMPILLRNASDSTPAVVPLGNSMPDFRLGWSNNVSYKRFSAYVLVDATMGQDVWNEGFHWALGDFMTGVQDQTGKSVEDARPIGYWWRAGPGLGGSSGVGGFYDALNGPNRYTLEDASYAKIREVSVSYRVGSVAGVGNWVVGVVGRNLLTFTDYRGFDPEVGLSGGELNSAALTGVDRFTFPNLRTFTLQLSSTF